MDFQTLAQYANEQKASDIHLAVGLPPMLRVLGEIREVRIPALSTEGVMSILHSVMNEEQKAIFEKDWEIDFSMTASSQFRYRVNAYMTINGPSVAFRSIPVIIKSLEEIQAPSSFESFTNYHKGIVLVTGPTGSGKSTTLAALINHINTNQPKHIITIEDPIEFIHKSKKALINQREVGANTKTFAAALKSALREDPDVILVGELRDLESIRLALTAAETGHLVYATLHTSSAAKTIDRIIDVFPGEDKGMVRTMLSSSIQAVISQRLLKRKDGTARVAAYEIMVATNAIRNLIRENKIPQIHSLIQVGSKYGMILMEDYIKNLIANNIVSENAASEILEKEELLKPSIVSQRSSEDTAHNTIRSIASSISSSENSF